MKANLPFFAIVLSSLLFSSCYKGGNDGPLRTETRNPQPFTALDMRLAGSFSYVKDTVYRVEISAGEDMLEYIKTDVVNGKLVVRKENGAWFRSEEKIMVRISAPAVRDVELSGSGDFSAIQLSGSSVALHLSGSGDIYVGNLTGDRLHASTSGSGRIRVQEGRVLSQRLLVSGSGDLELSGLTSDEVESTTSGSGTIKVNALQKLDVTIAGSGSVYYLGRPAVSSRITGSGRVQPL